MICSHCLDAVADDAPSCPACDQPPLLEGRYRLDAILGRGAVGTTFQATRLADGRQVAIKDLPFSRVADLKSIELFEREASVLQQLDHPQIPRYVDHFQIRAGKTVSLYIVQELIDGQTLAAEQESRRYTVADVLDVMESLLGVLDHLHGLSPPVIHRDIKPSNVIRRPDGTLALIDFGSVRDTLKDPDLGGSTVAGTFGYMAPEQFRGVAIAATDLYAVGALAAALLTRKKPNEMLDHAGRFDFEAHTSLPAAPRKLLRALLEPSVDARTPTATAALAHVRRTRAIIDPSAQPARTSIAAPAAVVASRIAVQRGMEVRSRRRMFAGAVVIAAGLGAGAFATLGPGASGFVPAVAEVDQAVQAHVRTLSKCELAPGTQATVRFLVGRGGAVIGVDAGAGGDCLATQMSGWTHEAAPERGFLLATNEMFATSDGFSVQPGATRVWHVVPRWRVRTSELREDDAQAALDSVEDAVARCFGSPALLSTAPPPVDPDLSIQFRVSNGRAGHLVTDTSVNSKRPRSWRNTGAFPKCVQDAVTGLEFDVDEHGRVNSVFNFEIEAL